VLVYVQDFVSGLVCCVNEPHHNSSLYIATRSDTVHKIGSTWYKVLYQHTMYICNG